MAALPTEKIGKLYESQDNDNTDDSYDDSYWSLNSENIENSYTHLPTSEEMMVELDEKDVLNRNENNDGLDEKMTQLHEQDIENGEGKKNEINGGDGELHGKNERIANTVNNNAALPLHNNGNGQIMNERKGSVCDYDDNNDDLTLNYKICSYCKQRVVKGGSDLYKKSYKCKRCREQRYCSKRCQKKDWNMRHRFICDNNN